MEKEFDSISLMAGLISSFLIVLFKAFGNCMDLVYNDFRIANFSLTILVEKILKVSRQYSFNKQK